ncbi:MAG: hypothetical protein IPN70_01310 [Candidatus Moraniibacteriota bacterium]|nr:MAG: hypothetical protein IPN70_01310 [Candidatus Moranbacteria bacterium]
MAIFFSGCGATLRGMESDLKKLLEKGSSFSSAHPTEVCERFYNKSKNLYRQCLHQEIETKLSPEDRENLYSLGPLSGCQKYSQTKNRASFQSCQIKTFVSQKVREFESWRRKNPPL